ncbi:collagen alpha-1(XXI) chain-like isoform X2 [Littorina saxatilis]|uniref:collagen alpha-1(XXI) chain-like isoform X2 n=1 Tax=Littorina saxatilis TaxID=31220 RepID=UPI0038B5B9C8
MGFFLILTLVIVGLPVGVLAMPADLVKPWEYDGIEECKNSRADIYFLLGSTSSVWIVDYDKQLEFVVSLVNHFHIHPNITRVGLGIFADDFLPVIDIGDYPDKDTLIRAIRLTRYLSGNRYTDKGLKGLRTYGFRPGVVRPGVKKIGVVVTDGPSRYHSNTGAEATLAREENIWLLAIGVGGNVGREELSIIASQPKDRFVFHVASFSILGTLAHTLALSTCSLHLPQADNTTCRRRKKMDVMFVYNAAAMSSRNINKVREFTRLVMGEFSIASGNVRVGVISQGCQGGDIELAQYINQEDLAQALVNYPQAKLDSLLRKLRRWGYYPAREGRHLALKMAVVFVDDVIASKYDVLYEALLLGYEDVLIYVVAIGENYDMSEVNQLATSQAHVTQMGSYDDLLNLTRIQQFLFKFCERT